MSTRVRRKEGDGAREREGKRGRTRISTSSISARYVSRLYSPSRYLKSWLRVNGGVPSIHSSARTQPSEKTSTASVTLPSRLPNSSASFLRAVSEPAA